MEQEFKVGMCVEIDDADCLGDGLWGKIEEVRPDGNMVVVITITEVVSPSQVRVVAKDELHSITLLL